MDKKSSIEIRNMVNEYEIIFLDLILFLNLILNYQTLYRFGKSYNASSLTCFRSSVIVQLKQTFTNVIDF